MGKFQESRRVESVGGLAFSAPSQNLPDLLSAGYSSAAAVLVLGGSKDKFTKVQGLHMPRVPLMSVPRSTPLG